MATQLRIQARIRLGVLAALAALAACGGDSKGPTDTEEQEPELRPDPTPVGAPTGPAVTKTIGPEGGSLTSADGRLTLTVPAGAVSAPTEFGIQPITNESHGGVGPGYRLTPQGQTFADSLELSFVVSEDDLKGGAPEWLGLAYQDENGGWWATRPKWVDEANLAVAAATGRLAGSGATGKRGSVKTKRTGDWTKGWVWWIMPMEARVKVKKTVTFDLIACIHDKFFYHGGASALAEGKPVPKGICRPTATDWEWWVANGTEAAKGGNATLGTVVAKPTILAGAVVGSNTSSAVYTAPAKRPPGGRVSVAAFMVGRPLSVMAEYAAVYVEDDRVLYRVTGTLSRQGHPIVLGPELVADVADRFEVDVLVREVGENEVSAQVLMSPNANSGSSASNIRFRPGIFNYCDFRVSGAYDAFTVTSGEAERLITAGVVWRVTVHGILRTVGYTLFLPMLNGCQPTVTLEPATVPTPILFEIDANRLLKEGDRYITEDLASLLPGSWLLTIERRKCDRPECEAGA